VARRITRRLERLRSRVEALGGGDLGARVEVEGNDEVADLARSFNRAAGRIEALVGAQRRLLAGASHELRSPLARLRVAAELLARDGRRELRDRVALDIAELDELVDELLTASRLETLEQPARRDGVELLGLVAEEAARARALFAEVRGEPSWVEGDPRLLRRLIRNLIENAVRHGGGSPVEASVSPLPSAVVRLRVADRGPGVPRSERERIFEAFYRASGTPASDGVGVGLGLSLVRQIARLHGGEARCLAREGGGTCFEVDFPSSSPPTGSGPVHESSRFRDASETSEH
jgi:signal transduction histidine kinase